jgi:hypothetical protein
VEQEGLALEALEERLQQLQGPQQESNLLVLVVVVT